MLYLGWVGICRNINLDTFIGRLSKVNLFINILLTAVVPCGRHLAGHSQYVRWYYPPHLYKHPSLWRLNAYSLWLELTEKHNKCYKYNCYNISFVSLTQVRWALASKPRGHGFKSLPGTVTDPVIRNICGAGPGWKLAFELNRVTKDKQGTFTFTVTW